MLRCPSMSWTPCDEHLFQPDVAFGYTDLLRCTECGSTIAAPDLENGTRQPAPGPGRLGRWLGVDFTLD